MHRLVIGFDNGNEIEVVCEEFKITSSNVTGELTKYDITGINGDVPFFMKCGAIEYIIEKKGEKDGDI